MRSMQTRFGASVAILGIAAIVLSWLQPAQAHLGTSSHLWRVHIRPMADARYLQNTRVYATAPFTAAPLGDADVTGMCPFGWQATGGGVDFEDAAPEVRIISSAPLVGDENLFTAEAGRNAAGQGWRVTMHNNGPLPVDGVVGVVCAK